jgi:hypothetical protein
MFLMGLGALLVLGGILHMARATIWRGPLSGRDPPNRFAALWSHHGAASDSDLNELAGPCSYGNRSSADVRAGFSIGYSLRMVAKNARAFVTCRKVLDNAGCRLKEVGKRIDFTELSSESTTSFSTGPTPLPLRLQ